MWDVQGPHACCCARCVPPHRSVTSKKVEGASVPTVTRRVLVCLTSGLERFSHVDDLPVVECLTGLLACLSDNSDNECDGYGSHVCAMVTFCCVVVRLTLTASGMHRYLLHEAVPVMVQAFTRAHTTFAIARSFTVVIERLSHEPSYWAAMPGLGATKVRWLRMRSAGWSQH